MSNYDATGGEQGWIMKSKLNELRLDAGIARIENQQWLCVLDKETGMMIDPMIGLEKFAELMVKECCIALNPMLRDMISRGQGVDMIKLHFGMNPKEITTRMLDTAIDQMTKQIAEKKNDS